MSDETDHGAPAPGHDRTGHDRTGHEPPAEEVAAFATWLRGTTGIPVLMAFM